MEKIANLDLPSFSDRVQAEVVAAIQAELTATIDDLANSVRHLALRAKLTESIVDAREAERSAEALRIAAWATEEVEPQLSVERVIKTPDRISERPPRGGLSDSGVSRTYLFDPHQ